MLVRSTRIVSPYTLQTGWKSSMGPRTASIEPTNHRLADHRAWREVSANVRNTNGRPTADRCPIPNLDIRWAADLGVNDAEKWQTTAFDLPHRRCPDWRPPDLHHREKPVSTNAHEHNGQQFPHACSALRLLFLQAQTHNLLSTSQRCLARASRGSLHNAFGVVKVRGGPWPSRWASQKFAASRRPFAEMLDNAASIF